MDSNSKCLQPFWGTEDEDDDNDSIFSSEDEEEDLAMYKQLVQERVLARSVGLMHRQRSFGRGTLLWVIEGSKKITLLQILFTMIISSVEGKIVYVANDSYAVPHS
jgi:hypothetical protein